MKGVAIISVVIGHCSISWIEGFVNQYHLAVFYFIAGYFFNPSYFDTPWIFIKKRVTRLYLPFIGYGFAFLLFHNLFCHWGFYPSDQIYSFSEWLRNLLLLVIRMTSSEPFMGAMWFPVSLLTVSLLYLLINRIKIVNKCKTGGGNFLFYNCLCSNYIQSQESILYMGYLDDSSYLSYRRTVSTVRFIS